MMLKFGFLTRGAIAGAAAVVFSLALSVGASANLITNGDFEACSGLAPLNATLTTCGWTFANQAGAEAGGNPGKAVRLETAGSPTLDPTAQQTVTGLSAGVQYLLSWDRQVRFNFGGTGPSFGVFLDTQTFGSALFLLPSGTINLTYLTEQVLFTASSTTHTFIFAGELDSRTNGASGSTDVSHRIDNVSLVQSTSVPEPGTLALFGLGLAGLGFARRKRAA